MTSILEDFMQILKVIPATKIPLSQNQFLTYFSTENVKIGSLVKVNLRNRDVLALVIGIEHLRAAKMDVRKANFKLKKIEKVISGEEIIKQELRELILWSSLYYWEPLGLLIKKILPTKSLKKWQSLDPIQNFSKKNRDSSKIFYNEISSIQFKNFIGNLKKTEQILLLYPEISKLKEAIDFFQKNCEKNIAFFHSSLKIKERWRNWKNIYSGKAKIILSTRQGIFLPFYNLKTIIVNEEDNSSYKSWDQHPKINAKHLALKLAELHKANIILTSKTPSLETYWNIKEKRYKPTGKIFQTNKNIEMIDMAQELEKKDFQYLSPKLKKEIRKRLEKKEKVLLFQNRRGTATYIFCQDCGYFYKCPQCDFSLVYHKNKKKLLCHWCDHEESLANVCKKCQSTRLKYSGHGIQKINQEVKKMFPNASILLLDSDAAPTLSEKERIYNKFKKLKTGSILITTSSILSIPFDNISLGAFLNIDLIKNFPNFSTNEKTVKLIKKIANRSEKTFIQTYDPENSLLKMITTNKYDKIYQDELSKREDFAYPPFWQIVRLRYRHRKENVAQRQANKLFSSLEKLNKNNDFVQILGPLPPNRPKIKGLYYRIIVLKVKRGHFKERNQFLRLIPPSWDIDVDALEI